ncbi:Anti-sigma regulatory factor (Ser/Thr protein kinase) [Quadrisphaera granulorum]|uniref:Anti-sigma regulatory factor (Ser/Thr protein kinase) n=1 Tax=Quadrisphaera granulorum TaxID=317664 RepID=A0A316A2E9_9ACTN|nr:ATP-binding protein [Quadrisphaera granulorum]PWJ51150.1 anti-sigma regulatory factor (Ser/Thr protein kinase) [Quadrisphaera granulorum]SZE97800.1 Anti-sigma regulatory factor (Ser/Thr protein kinase) [Quadrisphaera granulorum]
MGSECARSFLALPHDDGAARTVRAHLAEVGAAWNPQVLHAALLLATEAVTNAVRHAPAAPVLVRIADDDEQLGIEVVDGGTSPLPPLHCQDSRMPSTCHLGGRGLPLFGLLSDGWGSQLEKVDDSARDSDACGERHVVWFTLAHSAQPLTRAARRERRTRAQPVATSGQRTTGAPGFAALHAAPRVAAAG